MKITKIAFLLMLSIAVISCNEDEDTVSKVSELSLVFTGLETLGDDYVYEGWLIVDEAPVTTGTFSVSADGTLSKSTFEVSKENADAATKFVLSIEPAQDSDPAPADTKVLVGDLADGSASLNTSIVGDFSAAAGSFFLRTPTDETGGNNSNDENGVWFGDPATATPDFVLPTLPAGWAYEGWVVGEAGPITTGTFTEFGVADLGAPYSGVNPGPPLAGEDFFLNAPTGEMFPLDVRGRTVVISVEPVPDNSSAPFALKPLVGTAGQDTAPTTYAFGQNLTSLITGTATIK